MPSTGEQSSGLVPHVTIGAKRVRVERQFAVELGVGVGRQGCPMRQRLSQSAPFGA